MNPLKISTKISSSGFDLIIDNKIYSLRYPFAVWNSYPVNLRKKLADSAAFIYTQHFVFTVDKEIVYNFPPPVAEPFFFQGLINQLPETTIEFSEFQHTTSDLIKRILNSYHKIKFSEIPGNIDIPEVYKSNEKSASILFTLGKDSLLSYALCEEIGLKTDLYYINEPYSPHENKHKKELGRRFEKKFGSKINFIDFDIGRLRQDGKEMWGWDMLLLGYSIILMPYLFFKRASYLILSDEQDTNELEFDKEGYLVNVNYEQSSQWSLYLNSLLRQYFCQARVLSIIEPIYEFAITYILHKRYPSIAKYQSSCCGDDSISKDKRWCGVCFECARMYIFLTALGINPQLLDFNDDMLSENKTQFFDFLIPDLSHDSSYYIEKYGSMILAFYLSYKRGAKGQVMEIFKSKYLKIAEKNKEIFVKKYLGISGNNYIPNEIKDKIMGIYKSEMANFLTEINSIL